MPSFNLVDEPWIGFVDLDGRFAEVSMKEALSDAARLREVNDESPLVSAAIYRLLLAILHRVFGPPSEAAWTAIWKSGKWDSAALEAYFSRWRGRFDLFDEAHPFYQTPGLDARYARAAAKLAPECASSGNNITLFDHGTGPSEHGFTSASIARQLVAYQSFTVGGLVSLCDNEDPKTHKSAQAGLLAKSAVAVCRGRNLFETLMLNLVPYDHAERPYPPLGEDRPAWESDSPTDAVSRMPLGHLDLLTWQSRRVRLLPHEDSDGATRVRDAVIMKGFQIPPDFTVRGREQMVAYTKNPKAGPSQEPWSPLGFRPGRTLWRDSLALVQTIQDRTESPGVVEQSRSLLARGAIDLDPIPVDLFGMTTDRANVLLWRHEAVPLSRRVLTDDDALGSLDIALQLAEAIAGALRAATRRMAQVAISPGDGGQSADKTRVALLTRAISRESQYWWALNSLFPNLVRDVGASERASASDVLSRWLRDLRSIASQGLAEAADSLEPRAQNLHGNIIAERLMARLIWTAADTLNIDSSKKEPVHGSAA